MDGLEKHPDFYSDDSHELSWKTHEIIAHIPFVEVGEFVWEPLPCNRTWPRHGLTPESWLWIRRWIGRTVSKFDESFMVEGRGSFDALFIFRFGTVLYIYLKVSNPSKCRRCIPLSPGNIFAWPRESMRLMCLLVKKVWSLIWFCGSQVERSKCAQKQRH